MKQISAFWIIVIISILIVGCSSRTPYQKEALQGMQKIKMMLAQVKRTESPPDASAQVGNLKRSIDKLIKKTEKIGEGKSSLTKIKVLAKKTKELGEKIGKESTSDKFSSEVLEKKKTLEADLEKLIGEIEEMVKEDK